MTPIDATIYDRARRLASNALWAIHLQRTRLRSQESTVNGLHFAARMWIDAHFLMVAFVRLRRCAVLAKKISKIRSRMEDALVAYDAKASSIMKMRNVFEHIDDYSLNSGNDRSVSHTALEVASFDGDSISWLGYHLDINECLVAAEALFKCLQDCAVEVSQDSPNQALEPTSTSVTDPAGAGSAPAVDVAHL